MTSLDLHVDVIEPVDHDEEDEDDGEEDARGHIHVHGVDDASLAEPSPLLLVVGVFQRDGHLKCRTQCRVIRTTETRIRLL